MLEKYYMYRVKYKDYVIIMKYGSFYETIDNDALIINSIFKYKINKLKNTFKVGFPISNINYIISKLDELNINYIVIDNNDILYNNSFSNNHYIDYNFNINAIQYNLIVIDDIVKYLMDNLLNNNISNKLDKIKEIISE